MAKKKESAPEVQDPVSQEMVPVLFPSGSISHWVPKAKN